MDDLAMTSFLSHRDLSNHYLYHHYYPKMLSLLQLGLGEYAKKNTFSGL